MKKILFVCDCLSKFKLETDTTYFLMVTAKEESYNVFYALSSDVYIKNDQVFANVKNIQILHSVNDRYALPWYEQLAVLSKVSLHEFDIIMVRNDPPFDMEYYYLTQALTIAEKHGVRVINGSNALRNFNEKLSILNFPQLITPTLVTKNKEEILDFLYEHGACVLKPLDQMAGRGIFKITLEDVNCNPILESSTSYFTQTIMLQKFIPEVVHGDRRIFVVNGQVVPYCLWRIPQNNQIRGNIASGGRGEVHPLSLEETSIAQCVAVWLMQEKIYFAGLDVIGDKLTEINITSPTGIQQIFENADINIAKILLTTL